MRRKNSYSHHALSSTLLCWTAACLAVLFICLDTCSVMAQGDSGFKFVEVTVTDPDGKPLEGVEVNVDTDGMQFPMATNAEGKVSLNVSSSSGSNLSLGVKHKDFAADKISWRGKAIPKKYSFKLEKGVQIGGLVYDDAGEPIAGAKIETTRYEISAQRGLSTDLRVLATSDEKGGWKAQVKDTSKNPLPLKITHNDYKSHRSYKTRATWDELKKLDHVLTLERGIQLKGRVTDPEGNPVARAFVFLGSSRYQSTPDKKKNTTETDDEGNYRYGNVPAGSQIITVAANGLAPELRTVTARKNMEAIDFQLEKGCTAEFLITDVDGLPISDANVTADDWRGHRSLPVEWYRKKSNASGVVKFDNLPADEIQFDVFKRGYMQARSQRLVAREEPHKVVLPWPLVVEGKVVDAESGLPIEAFNVVQGIDWGNNNQSIHWERYNTVQGSNGKYKTEFDYPRAGHYVRIEAAGYKPVVSRMLKNDEGDVKIHFELEEGTGPNGMVKTPNGKPAVGAKFIVATPGESIYIYNGHAQQHETSPPAVADAQGKFALPYLENDKVKVLCRHDSGYIELSGKELKESMDITLKPWSTVKGKVLQGDQPLSDEQVFLSFDQPYVHNAPQIRWNYSATSNSAGEFVFNQVVAKEVTVGRRVKYAEVENSGYMSANSHTESTKFEPGTTVQIQLGGKGGAVHGKVKVPEAFAETVDWSMGIVRLTEQNPQAAAGGFFQAIGQALAQGNNPRRPVRPQPTFRRNYASAIDEKGGFAIRDVLPGTYQLNAQLYTRVSFPGGGYSWNSLGNYSRTITIPETKEGEAKGPVDAGEFTLQMTKQARDKLPKVSFQGTFAPTVVLDAIPAPVTATVEPK